MVDAVSTIIHDMIWTGCIAIYRGCMVRQWLTCYGQHLLPRRVWWCGVCVGPRWLLFEIL